MYDSMFCLQGIVKVIQSADNPDVYLEALKPRENCAYNDWSCSIFTWILMTLEIHWGCQRVGLLL